MHIIIDGYNLIRQSDHLRRFEKSSLEAGRQALIRFLMPYSQTKGHRITIVFDGWKQGSSTEARDREGSLHIIYSRQGEKADEVIKKLVASSGDEIMVVTSDRDIVSFVERRGGTAVSSPDFEAIVALKFREMGPGPALPEDKEGDEDDPPEARKKGPAKRLSRRERDYRRRLGKL